MYFNVWFSKDPEAIFYIQFENVLELNNRELYGTICITNPDTSATVFALKFPIILVASIFGVHLKS